ncbi:hypothetical protein HCJ70_13720 [Listeria booriae]|uniref:hypothetical protein n=1 Tax=Listeria booriae TaxID=1552123 RepID=UPI001628CE23|nr:hypothetical protein [Listeria booriae]MBC2100104.1 hypothetical protein [Listeria booriae]
MARAELIAEFSQVLTKKKFKTLLDNAGISYNPKQLDNDEYYNTVFNELLVHFEDERLVELIVERNQQGFPLYSYHINSIDFFECDRVGEGLLLEGIENERCSPCHQISIEDYTNNDDLLSFVAKIKEYTTEYSYGINARGSLENVYYIPVELKKNDSIVSIHSGNSDIEKILSAYLKNNCLWDIDEFSLPNTINGQENQFDVSFKTALILDYIYNRLPEIGMLTDFSTLRFNVDDTNIKKIMLNGSGLFASPTACEYVTLGKEISRFDIAASYRNEPFDVRFSLTGDGFRSLKITITSKEGNLEIKKEALFQLQNVYIELCLNGVSLIEATRNIITRIKETYLNGEKQMYSKEVVDIIGNNIRMMEQIIPRLNQDEYEFLASIFENEAQIIEMSSVVNDGTLNVSIASVREMLNLDPV